MHGDYKITVTDNDDADGGNDCSSIHFVTLTQEDPDELSIGNVVTTDYNITHATNCDDLDNGVYEVLRVTEGAGTNATLSDYTFQLVDGNGDNFGSSNTTGL